jgi:multidrug resistance efflux pump
VHPIPEDDETQPLAGTADPPVQLPAAPTPQRPTAQTPQRPTAQAPVVLLAGFEPTAVAELRAVLAGGAGCDIRSADSVEELRRALAGRDLAVLCLGPRIPSGEVTGLLASPPAQSLRILLTAAGPDPDRFQELIDEDRLFYLSPGPLPAADLGALIRSALAQPPAAAGEETEAPPPAFDRRARQALQTARRVAAQGDLAGAGELLQLALAEAVTADRTYCLLYDPADQTLWSRGTGLDPEARQESPAVGLVSFVARTGQPVRTENLTADPRYERQADDPLGPAGLPGAAGGPLLAVPVRSGDGAVLAVLCAVRNAGRRPFTADETAEVEQLAEAVALPLDQLVRESRLEAAGRAHERLLRERTTDLFREEAVEHYLGTDGREGDWLRISPRWMRATFWLLVAFVAAALLYSVVGTLDEHATGPAVVRLSGRTEVTADQPGTVAAVLVQVGERVAAGAPLVRFASAREAAELARLEREWELQLVDRLRDPADPAPARSLLSLRAEIDLARSRLAERVVRAPGAGTVRDVRCRPEQHVAAGEILLSLGGGRAAYPLLVAVLPGEHRPRLRPGLPLSVEIRGFDHAPQQLAVTTVSAEVVGPAEAQRLLGSEIAASVQLSGPVVLVQARFPAATFTAGGQRFALHDGMWGQAEVRVRSERLIVALVPGLRAALERWRG